MTLLVQCSVIVLLHTPESIIYPSSFTNEGALIILYLQTQRDRVMCSEASCHIPRELHSGGLGQAYVIFWRRVCWIWEIDTKGLSI